MGRGLPTPRWLLILHRYLGVAVGLLMLVWCLSGVVMLFVRYPELSQDRRFQGLQPIPWTLCCRSDPIADAQPIASARIEALGGAPVARVRTTDGRDLTLNLSNGRAIELIDADQALAAARAFAVGTGLGGRAGKPQTVDLDQWTVSGQFRRDRPLYKVPLGDAAGSELYVSSRTGEAVQLTSRAGRFWNWLGAVPHWLYPTLLRRDAALWTQVAVWTSLTGCFLTLTGLYVGVAALRRFPGRWSPYRRVWLWHHLAGAGFGILTLAWVASGLVSMNPWGFLESPGDRAAERLAGPAPSWGQVRASLQRLSARSPGPAVVSVSTAPFDGRLFLLAADAHGGVTRLDARGAPAPLTRAELSAAARRVARVGPIVSEGLLPGEDAYYFRHHEPVLAPAYRVILQDRTRYYLDARTGALLRSADADARAYRWLHEGLHRWDFIAGLHDGPAWSVLMLALLAGVTLGVGTGVYLGAQAIIRDVRRLLRVRP